MNASPSTPRRPRVLQCITRLGLGGAERVAFSLVRSLRHNVGFAVFTVHGPGPDPIGKTMQNTLRTLEVPWFTGTTVPMKRGGMVPGAIALARAVRRFQPDMLHFHSETPEACGAMMAQLSPRRDTHALVRTVHNSVFWRYWPRIGRWCDRRLRAAHIACVSDDARQEFLRYRADSGAGPPPQPPVVIYNGVDTTRRPPHSAPQRARERRLLFAGRFEYQKGTDILHRALPAVRLPPGTTGHLTLIGHGAHEPMLRAWAASPPPGWSIEVRGVVASLEEVFPQFDLVVMPSRFEGLGLVAIEATLSGLPVVTTAAPGLGETLPPEYPWRAEPDDAQSLAKQISAALGESSHWARVVASAQEFARARFSPEAMSTSYAQLYARAAAGAASG